MGRVEEATVGEMFFPSWVRIWLSLFLWSLGLPDGKCSECILQWFFFYPQPCQSHKVLLNLHSENLVRCTEHVVNPLDCDLHNFLLY